MTHLLNVNATAILADGDLLGRVIDTFVTSQILPLCALTAPRVTAYHLRDTNGRRKIDLLLEGPQGKVVGIEIKAKASPEPRDARHLEWLRHELGDTFANGIVLHTGTTSYPLGDSIWALPIAAIWR